MIPFLSSLSSSTVRQLSLSDNMQELQKVMVGVGVSKETALRCFTKEQALLAIQYLSTSLFQHYRLFQLLYTEQQEEECINTKVTVHTHLARAGYVPAMCGPLTQK